MVTILNLLKASFGLFLLTQCNAKEDSSKVVTSLAVINVDNPLVGEWKYKNTIWYASELTLRNDVTFTYHDQSCNGQRFSQGRWTISNGSIFLTSFDTFKQKEVAAPSKTVEAMERQDLKRKLKNGKVEYSFVGCFKETTAPSLPTAGDTVRVYLDNIQLQLKNDTLYCVGSNRLPEQAPNRHWLALSCHFSKH